MPGEKHKTSTQNLQQNNVGRQVEGFCTLYFASFSRVNHKFWCHLEYAGQSTAAILEVKASFRLHSDSIKWHLSRVKLNPSQTLIDLI